MTEPETTHPIPDSENESSATAIETEISETDAEPPPEPWTPERVSEWNAYYDFYVKLAALLLVFMVACNYVTDTQVWLHLKSGQLIAEQGCDRRNSPAARRLRIIIIGKRGFICHAL